MYRWNKKQGKGTRGSGTSKRCQEGEDGSKEVKRMEGRRGKKKKVFGAAKRKTEGRKEEWKGKENKKERRKEGKRNGVRY